MIEKSEGFLEVGHTEDTHEIVINHPDLKPDENGVGHIVFSPRQAVHLANLLLRHAGLVIEERVTIEHNQNDPGGYCVLLDGKFNFGGDGIAKFNALIYRSGLIQELRRTAGI